MQLQSLCSSRLGQTGVPQKFVKTGDQASVVAQQQAAEQAGVQAGWGLWQPLLPCKGHLLTCTCHQQVKAQQPLQQRKTCVHQVTHLLSHASC